MATTRRIETNDRIYQRFVPSFQPQISLDVRPVQTKYTTMQINDERPHVNTPHDNRKLYNVNNDFLPVAYGAPANTFLTNIDQESILRNQFFALQKCNQKEYVPSSNSDLYKVEVVGRKENNAHSLLFNQDSFKSSNSKLNFKDNKMFNNNTSIKLN